MQFEGAYQEDGKGPSIWDTWTNKLGRNIHGDPKVHNNDTGDQELVNVANGDHCCKSSTWLTKLAHLRCELVPCT